MKTARRAPLRELRIPIVLFLLSLALDIIVTQRGLMRGGEEGNLVVVWLWGLLGGYLTAMFAWLVVVLVSAILLHRFFQFPIGLWILYSAFNGHLQGFLTWIPVLEWLSPIRYSWRFPILTHHFLLYGEILLLGAALTAVHRRLSRTAS